MSDQEQQTKPDGGASASTAMLGDGIPTFTFRGDELIGFIWHIYALARIVDAIKDMPELPKEADPMEDQGAQDELIQGWIDELQSLQVRDDGTVVFDERPWLVNCESPNAEVRGDAPLYGAASLSTDGFGGAEGVGLNELLCRTTGERHGTRVLRRN